MSKSTRPIGGFLDLEIARKPKQFYHHTIALSTGRACLSFILQQTQAVKIHLPYYICDTVLEPILKSGLSYSFYKLDHNLEIEAPPSSLADNELLLYVNYFGLKDTYIPTLQRKYLHQLIVDNTQAFFQKGYLDCWSFNSARKFFGVPDGAYLYYPKDYKMPSVAASTPSYDHLIQRMIGDHQTAYKQFLMHETNLNANIQAISEFSYQILGQVDYEVVAHCRQTNFNQLHSTFKSLNALDFNFVKSNVPNYYPLLIDTLLHDKLIEKKIFVPFLWADVINRDSKSFHWEKYLAAHLIPLPIDQRYGEKEMNRIIKNITGLLKR